MCGIAGILEFGRDTRATPPPCAKCAAPLPSRPRRRRLLHGRRGRHRHAPPQHRRRLPRAPAHFKRRTAPLDRIQRRDLQPSCLARATHRPRPSLQHPQRYRNHHPPFRRIWRRLRTAPARHVRLAIWNRNTKTLFIARDVWASSRCTTSCRPSGSCSVPKSKPCLRTAECVPS